jgi:hypothetical protein
LEWHLFVNRILKNLMKNKMNKLFWIVFLLLIQIGSADTANPKHIRIISTANVDGETDPCG